VSHLGSRVTFHRADAAALPLDDATVDVVVSGLVLNFVPDLDAALAEMSRVTARGGVVGAYIWDYADRMELMRWFWDAAVELDPDAVALDEGRRFGDLTPEGLSWRFASAGLVDVEAGAIEVPTPFTDFDDYWTPFLGGQGVAPAYAMSLAEPERQRLRERLRELVPTEPDGSIRLVARAWTVRGIVPG
jgi:SAM-dependent methyltransferase